MTTIRASALTITLAMFGVAYASFALAETDADQSAPANPPSAQSEPSSPTYSEQELKSFAVAVLDVERIKSNYAPKLAETLRQQAQVKQAASLELLQALKSHGMSVDKYQEMLAAAQSNPQLADKVNEYLKKSAEEKGPNKEPDKGSSNGESQPRPKSGSGYDPKQKVEEL